MTEANSPTYAIGLAHGGEDEARIKSCPAMAPWGEDPPFPDYPVMYLRGYWTAYTGVYHRCTRECRRRDANDNQDGFEDHLTAQA